MPIGVLVDFVDLKEAAEITLYNDYIINLVSFGFFKSFDIRNSMKHNLQKVAYIEYTVCEDLYAQESCQWED